MMSPAVICLCIHLYNICSWGISLVLSWWFWNIGLPSLQYQYAVLIDCKYLGRQMLSNFGYRRSVPNLILPSAFLSERYAHWQIPTVYQRFRTKVKGRTLLPFQCLFIHPSISGRTFVVTRWWNVIWVMRLHVFHIPRMSSITPIQAASYRNLLCQPSVYPSQFRAFRNPLICSLGQKGAGPTLIETRDGRSFRTLDNYCNGTTKSTL